MQGAGKIVPFDEVDARLKHPESTGELAQGQGIIAGETAYFDSAIMTKGMAFAQYGLFDSSSLHLFISLHSPVLGIACWFARCVGGRP